jgi:hypothetical protein
MSPGLLLPSGLLALFALLVPLALHLTRRTARQPTVFAALRWLQESQRPKRRLLFDELSLLALRLLLLAALAVLLAQPVLSGMAGGRAWVVVAPGIGRTEARAALDAPDATWHWLAPGFPLLERDVAAGTQPTSSLLRELDAKLAHDTELTVLVPTRLEGLDAERPALRRKVDWHIVDAKIPPSSTVPSPAVNLVVRYALADDPGLPYLRAVAATWHAAAPASAGGQARADIAPTSAPLGSNARWLVWLAPGALPPHVRAWIETGGTALLSATSQVPGAATGIALWRDTQGAVIVRGRALGNGRVLQLTRELAPHALPELLDPAFPDRLRALFDPPSPPQSAFARTHAPRTGGPTLPPMPHPLQPWLALLVGLLYLLERWLATSPRRERAT